MTIVMKNSTCSAVLRKGATVFQTVAYTSATIVVVAFIFTCTNYNEEMYTVETDYLRWVTRVPAYTVCPAVSGRFLSQQLSRLSKPGSSITPQNVSFFTSLLRPGKVLCPGCPVQWPPGLPSTNLSSLMGLLTPPCESLLTECQWNGAPFTCCQHFQPLVTKQGVCYSLNSEQTPDGSSGSEPFDMVTSYSRPQAELQVRARRTFSFHVHDRRAVNLRRPRFVIPLGKHGEVQYKFTETLSLDSAWELKPSQRFCVLDGELKIPGYNVYSHSACRLKCLADKQNSLCGCKHYLLPGSVSVCGTTGLQCLDQHSQNLTKLKCKCRRECSGQEVKFVHFTLTGTKERNIASAVVKLTKPPTERVVHYARITFIEMLVGFACLTRLITTANLYESLVAFWTMLATYASALRFIYHKSTKSVKVE